MDSDARVSAISLVLLLGVCCFPSPARAAEKAVMSPDGSTLAVPVGPRKAEVLDTGGVVLATFALDADLSELAFSKDGRRLAACLADGSLAVMDVAAKTVKKAPGESGKRCVDAFWTSQGTVVYVLGVRDAQHPDESGVEVRSFDPGGTARTIHSAKKELPARVPGKKEEPVRTLTEPPAKTGPLVVPAPPTVQPAADGADDSGRRGNRR